MCYMKSVTSIPTSSCVCVCLLHMKRSSPQTDSRCAISRSMKQSFIMSTMCHPSSLPSKQVCTCLIYPCVKVVESRLNPCPSQGIIIIIVTPLQSVSYRSSTSSHSSKPCPYMYFENMHPILHQSLMTSAPQCIKSSKSTMYEAPKSHNLMSS